MKKKEYSAPVARVFELIPQSLICQSPNDVLFSDPGYAGNGYDHNNIDDYGDL
ncbi:MAG: hypothetical protein MJY88_06375 [Bacteroidales bacterium]|nr:hypothetical protein [Bacteroidales bacterium]